MLLLYIAIFPATLLYSIFAVRCLVDMVDVELGTPIGHDHTIATLKHHGMSVVMMFKDPMSCQCLSIPPWFIGLASSEHSERHLFPATRAGETWYGQ